ncbi:hypothetical protein K439DRAFT_1656010 [Ramaria rubella]|nr:hypothetical protein K439DRAFT_1656010 [Ramaria rubella]
MEIEIWIVVLSFSSDSLSDDVYNRCLAQVDVPSQARIKRFYHREDSWRSLTGMLLPRALLRAHNISLESVTLSRTEAGKPFIESSGSLAVGYNITHDNEVVGMVAQLGEKQDINKIGIDVMKRALPRGETVNSFLKAIEETLTPAELAIFTPGLDDTCAVRYIFLLWTLKEAYTKALGLGLGFEFKRVEYNIAQSCVSVDGRPALGWRFIMFTMQSQGTTDIYQGAVAKWVGGEETQMEILSNIEKDPRFQLKTLVKLIP